MLCRQTCRMERREHLLDREETQLMNLGRVTYAVHGLNRILEVQARDPPVDLGRAESLHANARSCGGAARVVARTHLVGRKPRFDDDDAIRFQMLPETAQRLRDAIARLQVADRAEQA